MNIITQKILSNVSLNYLSKLSKVHRYETWYSTWSVSLLTNNSQCPNTLRPLALFRLAILEQKPFCLNEEVFGKSAWGAAGRLNETYCHFGVPIRFFSLSALSAEWPVSLSRTRKAFFYRETASLMCIPCWVGLIRSAYVHGKSVSRNTMESLFSIDRCHKLVMNDFCCFIYFKIINLAKLECWQFDIEWVFLSWRLICRTKS